MIQAPWDHAGLLWAAVQRASGSRDTEPQTTGTPGCTNISFNRDESQDTPNSLNIFYPHYWGYNIEILKQNCLGSSRRSGLSTNSLSVNTSAVAQSPSRDVCYHLPLSRVVPLQWESGNSRRPTWQAAVMVISFSIIFGGCRYFQTYTEDQYTVEILKTKSPKPTEAMKYIPQLWSRRC